MRDFRKLDVWRKAHQLALAVYGETRCYPDDERYGLTSQSRRCAASIAANLAEGCGRSQAGDFGRFLEIAAGSASELEYHFLLARDLNILDEAHHSSLSAQVREVKQMLAALIRKVRNDREGTTRSAGTPGRRKPSSDSP